MASNSFGNVFKMTTWGESHGKAIGVVIDGCPAGIAIDEKLINAALKKRAPGSSIYVSPRKEKDKAEILSGVFEGMTTGHPISIVIWNKDVDSSKYEPIKDILRPGHANYTYQTKYGIFDFRGGGRASARETACRVAAGAVAKQLLNHFGIDIVCYLLQMHDIKAATGNLSFNQLFDRSDKDPFFCPDPIASERMKDKVNEVKQDGDSVGGIVEFLVSNLPVGLGDPTYEKLDANLTKALMSIHGSKGVEIGDGFDVVDFFGSESNDTFELKGEQITTKTNHAGGILGGISNGMPLIGRVAFKPTSSIVKSQKTVDKDGQDVIFEIPKGSRHDPCVAIRAVKVVEAMVLLTLADAVLLDRIARL